MRKQKNMRYAWSAILCALTFLILCTGCDRIAQEKYNMQDYCTEDQSLYNFTEQITAMGNIVATAMYGEEQILICQDVTENTMLRRKIWLFSYLTGEMKLCSNLEVEADADFYVTSSRYSVLSTSPFVFADMYEDKIYIYTDDFSDYSVVVLEKYTMPSGMFVCADQFYFMDFNTCRVYCHGLEEFSSETRKIDYLMLREESQMIFEPDFNTASFYLEDVSADGNYLRLFAENLQDNEYYYYLYNIKTEKYEEMYQLDSDASVLWNNWAEDKYLNEVLPSAVARFEMIDYTEKSRYTTKIEPQVVYSVVRYDTNISDTQSHILFYAVDEHTELISELFLWEYAKAECDAAGDQPDRNNADLPVQIDYAQLTDKAQILEEKYGINIIMGENVTCDFEAYDYKQVTDAQRINAALEQLELALEAFPDGMCEEMASDYAIGFNIYLCGTFTPKNNENISDAGAFFVFENGYYNLAMNIMLDNTEANVIHEMTHAIDDYFVFCGASEQLEDDWQACNPEGFTYLQSYFGYEELYEYTYADDYESIDDIYFSDSYARTFPGEDRSRVFEYFGSEYFKDDWILESQSLRRKARLLLDYCTQYMECFSEDDDYGLKRRAEELGW